MCFACIEGDDHTLVLEIYFYIVHAFNFHERHAQPSHSLEVILAFGADFNGFQNRVIGASREKGIGWIGIAGSCRVHRLNFTYLTCDTRVVVVPHESRFTNTRLQPGVAGTLLA